MQKNRVLAIEMTDVDSGTLGAAYVPINTNGLDESCFMIRIINDTTNDITVSFNGVTDNEYVRSGETLQLYAVPSGDRSEFGKGSVVYAKGTAGNGTVYLSGYYKMPS